MITLEQGDFRLQVAYDYSPGTPDVMHFSNGDPGYPGDPEELDIISVEIERKVDGQWQRTGIDLMGWVFEPGDEPDWLIEAVESDIAKERESVENERAWQGFQENP